MQVVFIQMVGFLNLMNKEQFKKNIGNRLKLRPPIQRRILPHEFPGLGGEIFTTDDEWIVENVSGNGVELRNTATGHVITLGYDNIREFRSPNFLLLRCQLTLEGNRVIIEPV
jgi:hypothetical protein